MRTLALLPTLPSRRLRDAVPDASRTHGRHPIYLALALSLVVSILSLMAHYAEQLNGIFQALADPTRRSVLGRLSKGPASISELAEPFDMALPSFMKHIHALEESGWIRTRKEGRVRTCAIEKKPFAAVEGWLSAQRALWEGRTDRLEQFVTVASKKGKSK
jgi:DNA-binding transcriptional ArsR family regulator